MAVSFEYGQARVRDLVATGERHPRTGRFRAKSILIDGRDTQPTSRFWKSFFMRFGISDNVFRYFAPEEVFERISQRAADDTVRYCVEESHGQAPRLLAISKPDRPVIRHAEIRELAARYGGDAVKYAEGLVTSFHTPRGGDRTFDIGGDRFQHRFVMETPVDGFGHPKIYLSFLRLLCSNGMVGYAKAFRSDISLGKDIGHCIGRALDSFDNGEGYAALRQRFESSQASWASVRECLDMYQVLTRLPENTGEKGREFVNDFRRLTGNLNALYGVADLNALSVKRQRVLPARCRIYDLLNFASELATYHVGPESSRSMQAQIGGLISDEYDLEGTANDVTDFADFFVSANPENN